MYLNDRNIFEIIHTNFSYFLWSFRSSKLVRNIKYSVPGDSFYNLQYDTKRFRKSHEFFECFTVLSILQTS